MLSFSYPVSLGFYRSSDSVMDWAKGASPSVSVCECEWNFYLSYPRTPTSVSVSQMSIVLTRLSNGDELLSDGRTLTSRTQGLRVESTRTSKPYSSKQFSRLVGFFCKF